MVYTIYFLHAVSSSVQMNSLDYQTRRGRAAGSYTSVFLYISNNPP